MIKQLKVRFLRWLLWELKAQEPDYVEEFLRGIREAREEIRKMPDRWYGERGPLEIWAEREPQALWALLSQIEYDKRRVVIPGSERYTDYWNRLHMRYGKLQ